MVWYTPPSASARTPCGKRRAISAAALNSTSEPRLSPITWPSRQPCACASTASRALRGKPSATRAFSGGSFSQRLPVVARELRRGGRRAGEAAGDAALELAGQHDLLALGVERHAARGAHQRHAGGDVVLVHAVGRHRRDAVAGGDARQAVGDARHRDVARGRDRARPGAGPQRRGAGGEHELARGEQALREIDVRPACRCAAAGRRPRPRRWCRAPRSGESGLHAPRPSTGSDSCSRATEIAGAAPPAGEFAGAVVRIDQPASSPGRARA